MERLIRVHVERLPEGLYLASSDEVQGLVAQGRTVSETLEIARDVARRLLEAQAERQPLPEPPPIETFDLTLVVGA
jgi:predicted RNase H-like HicB family nuclease